MGISIFPSTAAEFVSNNFVVDMSDTTNNTADTGGVKQAGPYSMSFSSGDTSFDVYLIDEDGASVGYSNTTSIVASGLFSTVVILGVAGDEVISFLYQGSVNNADGEGDEPGAGAYLESISPADLPSIDDTATVIGGNFGTLTTIQFISGTAELEAKNITVTNGTSLIVTRPDNLIEDDAPYDLRAINTGVTPPTGTNAHILAGTVTAGSDPTWVTTSPLNAAGLGVAFSQTLEATDSDGTVVDYSVTAGTLTPGLSLNSSTGVLSGTATTAGNNTFTITATDDGGNETAKEFEQLVVDKATGGTTVEDGGFRYHTFTSSDDFITVEDLSIEWLIVGGGGGGGASFSGDSGGGGGAGGYLAGSASSGIGEFTVTIGAGGASTANGNDTTFGSFGSAIGGGAGARISTSVGGDGGSGGGGAEDRAGGTAVLSGAQGNDGGPQSNTSSCGNGGGGATAVGGTFSGSTGGFGGDGSNSRAAFATATGLIFDGGYFAGGGAGAGKSSTMPQGGLGGGGNSTTSTQASPESGATNSGGGGGGNRSGGGGAGGSGVVIVRYAI